MSITYSARTVSPIPKNGAGRRSEENGEFVERVVLYGIAVATILFLIFLWVMLFR